MTRRWDLLLSIALLATTACGHDGSDRHLFGRPKQLDPPPELRAFTIESGGERLLGRVLVAGGPGPNPTVLLLHGFPGNENNFDLAHALARAGWNAAVVHYRGSWGSSGQFSFGNVLEDVGVMLEFLTSDSVAQEIRSEAGRVYLVGHSMGGFSALYAASRRPDLVAGAASLAGFNFGASAQVVRRDSSKRRGITEAFEGSLDPLDAPSGKELVAEYLAAGTAWDLRSSVERLKEVPLFLVGALRDEVAPRVLHHAPLRNALLEAGHPDLASHILDDGHGFTASRVELTEVVWRWLEGLRTGLPGETLRVSFMGP